MKPAEFQARLRELGADVPVETLRRWATDNERLIPKPIPYYKPLKRKPGRPKKKDKGLEPQAQRGRFSYWTEESLEAAAAVWSIRYIARPMEETEDNLLAVKTTSQKDAPTSDIVKALQMARSLHLLLRTDCKEAANRFRTYLWPTGFSSQEEGRAKILDFGDSRLYSLIPVCIHAVEKVRHQIALNTPLSIAYEWVITENGSSGWKGMHIDRAGLFGNEILLRITHLRPCENGYSNDYGFPQVKEYTRNGFLDEFWLRGSQLGERIKPSPFHGVPEGFYDDQEYADYWDRDPYGWADIAAEYYDEDQE